MNKTALVMSIIASVVVTALAVVDFCLKHMSR